MTDQDVLDHPPIRKYVDELHTAAANGALHQETALVNWLFAVNAGGLVALLAHVAATGVSALMILAMVALFLGIALVMLHRVAMYYWLLWKYRDLTRDIGRLATGEIRYEDFVAVRQREPDSNRAAEILAWASGVLALSGGVLAAIDISCRS